MNYYIFDCFILFSEAIIHCHEVDSEPFILISFSFLYLMSNDTSDFELNQNLYENNKLKDFELFENANEFIDQR